jgi:hypothetical protein
MTSKSVIGLDIGSMSVRAAEARHGNAVDVLFCLVFLVVCICGL